MTRVLIDGAAIADYVGPAPSSPGKVIVEARGVGPLVLDASRISQLTK